MNPETIDKIWAKSGGKCECIKAAHNHPGGHCNKELVREMHNKSGAGGWKLLQMFVSSGENINAYAVYCIECFQQLPAVLQKDETYSGKVWGTT
ncbi:MAG: hypothetical protein GX226_06245 [Dehalococcoidales bacterium]|jgi:hypothetical protein|nr:hypothetical protein [Dehalococcoidales bacterium]